MLQEQNITFIRNMNFKDNDSYDLKIHEYPFEDLMDKFYFYQECIEQDPLYNELMDFTF